MTSLPSLTPQQRTDALAKALRVRQERADVRLRLRNGAVTLPQVIKDSAGSDAIAKMKVMSLLRAVPGVGPVRAAQIMARLGIPEDRRVRGLGPNQRKALGEEFDPAIA